MTTINDLRARLRKDLHDEDSGNYRWSDAELDRHLQHAVKDFSLACPLEQKTSLQTTPDSRELSLMSLTDLIKVFAVEFPSGYFPRSFVGFRIWSSTIYLQLEETPAGGETVQVYWGRVHTLDAADSTLPAQYEELVITGAAAFAALEWSSFATNRINLGGNDTWRYFLEWGQGRMKEFRQSLAELDCRRKLKVGWLGTGDAS